MEKRLDMADLARDSEEVLAAACKGEIVLVERAGEEVGVILDRMNYRILRAAARYCVQPPPEDHEAELLSDRLTQAPDEQARYDLVIGDFLDQRLSLSRAAQLLGTVYIDLRIRLHQLGLPTYQGPVTVEEALSEARVAESIARAVRTGRA